MNTKTSLSRLLACTALLLVAPGLTRAASDTAPATAPAPAGELIAIGESEAAWAAEAKKTYPLKTCLTSDEPLGSMGKAPEYIYRVAGQADRLVIFCCAGCEGDFLAAPEKYLPKLDPAKSAAPDAPAKPTGGHHDHS